MQSPSIQSPQPVRHSDSHSSESTSQEPVSITTSSSFNYSESSPIVVESRKKLIITSTTDSYQQQEEEESISRRREQEEVVFLEDSSERRPPQQQTQVVCKVYFKERNEIRRFKLSEISWTAFAEQIGRLFKLSPKELIVRYVDDEADLITLSTDSEFKEVFKLKIFNKQKEMKEKQKEVVEEEEEEEEEEGESIKNTNTIKFYIKLKTTPLSSDYNYNYNYSAPRRGGIRKREVEQDEAEEAESDLHSLLLRRQKFRAKQRRRQEKETFKSQKKACKRQRKLQARAKKAQQKMIKYNELNARFIKHVTIPDNTVVPPGATFIKTWKVRNEGSIVWRPETIRLKYLSREVGTPFGARTDRCVKIGKFVEPGEVVEVSANVTSPDKPGSHIGFWRLCTEEGVKFGHRLWCKIIVQEDAALIKNKNNNNNEDVEQEEELELEVEVVEGEEGEREAEGEGEGEKAEEMDFLLNKLAEMGFKDEEKNREMIKKCGSDIDNIVAVLSAQHLS